MIVRSNQRDISHLNPVHHRNMVKLKEHYQSSHLRELDNPARKNVYPNEIHPFCFHVLHLSCDNISVLLNLERRRWHLHHQQSIMKNQSLSCANLYEMCYFQYRNIMFLGKFIYVSTRLFYSILSLFFQTRTYPAFH